eukprot:PhM_4_TR10856/c0_g1_i1/m.86486
MNVSLVLLLLGRRAVCGRSGSGSGLLGHTLNDANNTKTTGGTDGDQTGFLVRAAELVHDAHDAAAASGGEGVPHSDGATVDVNLVPRDLLGRDGLVKAEELLGEFWGLDALHRRKDLGGEGLVDFKHVEVLYGETGLLEHLVPAKGGGEQKLGVGLNGCVCARLQADVGGIAHSLGLLFGHDEYAAGAVSEGRRRRGGDGAHGLAECRLHFLDLSEHIGVVLDEVVLGNQIAFAVAVITGDDLLGEVAFLAGGNGVGVAAGGKLFLLLAADLVQLGHHVTVPAHCLSSGALCDSRGLREPASGVVAGVLEEVGDGGETLLLTVDELGKAVGEVAGKGHLTVAGAVAATGDDDISGTRLDHCAGLPDGIETRSTSHRRAVGSDVLGQIQVNDNFASNVGGVRLHHNVAPDNVVNLLRV